MVESFTLFFWQASMMRIAALERDFQRLFDDHVLAGVGRRDGRLHVSAAGGADGDDVHRRIGQHVGQAMISLAAGFRGEFVGRRRDVVETGHQLGPFHVGNGLVVKTGDHSATDNAETVGHGEGSGFGVQIK